MKHSIIRILVIMILCGLSAPALQAQSGKISRFFMFTAKSDPRYARILMQEEAVRRAAKKSSQLLTQTEKQIPPALNFAQRNKQSLWKLQVNLGISRQQALKNLQKWGAYAKPIAKYPPLQKDQAFWTQDLTPFLVPLHSKIPAMPFYEREGYRYWGYSLPANGKMLNDILAGGFSALPFGVGTEELFWNNAILFPAIPKSALHNAKLIHNKTAKTIPTVLAIAPRSAKEKHNLEIKAAIVLLRTNGKVRWHRITPQRDGFLLTPYEFRPKN